MHNILNFLSRSFQVSCQLAASVNHKQSVNRHSSLKSGCHACYHLFLVAKNRLFQTTAFCFPIKLCDCLSYLFSIFLSSLSLFYSVSLLFFALFPPHSRHPSCFRLMTQFPLSRWFHFLLLIIQICLNAFLNYPNHALQALLPVSVLFNDLII